MTEIALEINGKSAFEYYTNAIPRVGENLELSHEYANGCFKVTNVTHVVSELKDGKVISYVKVEAETI